MLTAEDKVLLAGKGITEEQIEAQLQTFKKGFPFLKLKAAASLAHGILAPSAEECRHYEEVWKAYKEEGKAISKFVPASGAASRMFKNMFEFLDAEYDVPTTDFEKTFFAAIRDFAFYDELDAVCMKNEGRGIDGLVASGQYKKVVANMLRPEGLNYGQLPKGLLTFHRYESGSRTPLEEHLVEAALYAASKGKAEVHFTVSAEHKALFKALVEEKLPMYEKAYGVTFHVTFSEQKPATDTLAATMDNTVTYKQVLAGILVEVQQKAFAYLRKLDSGDYSHADIEEIIRFVQQTLFCRREDVKELEDAELVIYLRKKLNRPMRVCGVVKNVGEPGGGPFLAYNSDGTVSLQILESSQIDTRNPEYVAMFKNGTHFNPVDLVCAVKDYKGNKFNLPDYVDRNTGFISYKSKNGKELKALELPGLWNGAMSDWNTVFVEVPLSTFNPAKTVNDLLREQHQ